MTKDKKPRQVSGNNVDMTKDNKPRQVSGNNVEMTKDNKTIQGKLVATMWR